MSSPGHTGSKARPAALIAAALVVIAIIMALVFAVAKPSGKDDEKAGLSPTYQDASAPEESDGGGAENAPEPWTATTEAAVEPGEPEAVFEAFRAELLEGERSGRQIRKDFADLMTPTLAWSFEGADLSAFREMGLTVTDIVISDTEDGANVLATGTVGDDTTEVDLFRVVMLETMSLDEATGAMTYDGHVAMAIDPGATLKSAIEKTPHPISKDEMDQLLEDSQYATLQIVDPRRDALSEQQMYKALSEYFAEPKIANTIKPLQMDGKPVTVTEPSSAEWSTPAGGQPQILVGGSYMDPADYSRAATYGYTVIVGRGADGQFVLQDAKENSVGEEEGDG